MGDALNKIADLEVVDDSDADRMLPDPPENDYLRSSLEGIASDGPRCAECIGRAANIKNPHAVGTAEHEAWDDGANVGLRVAGDAEGFAVGEPRDCPLVHGAAPCPMCAYVPRHTTPESDCDCCGAELAAVPGECCPDCRRAHERLTEGGCQTCGAPAGEPCDCHDPQAA